MKPFKSGTIVAAWLLRITILWFVYVHYYKGFPGFDLKSFSFYIHAAYLVFALMLVAGGFMQKPAITVLSGLLILILPIVQLIHAFPNELPPVIMQYLLPISIGFFFFTAGNGK
jgi:hypothetical protein